MPPAVKKRKASSTSERLGVLSVKQSGIQAFAKITKARIHGDGKSNLKRKHIEEVIHPGIENLPEDKQLKKRKTGVLTNPFNLPNNTIESEVQKRVETRNRKRKASKEPGTPPPEQLSTAVKHGNLKKAKSQSQKLMETPTKGARLLLEKVALGASSSPARDSSPSPINDETPPSSPPSMVETDSHALPEDLQDLINLHSSFLTALSLYYAHNGLSNPADLRNLYPGIERTWKKRSVNLDDIRRILATTRDQHTEKHKLFYLSDFGHNKICVEIHETALESQGRILDEAALNETFTHTLSKRWSSFKKMPKIGPHSPRAFLSHLPLLPLSTSVSLTDLKPLLAKGQRRLTDLKAGAIANQARNAPRGSSTLQPSPLATTKPPAPSTPATRAIDLLDRLTAKSLQKSQLPAPLSAPQLARKRALQRLPEIAPVLQSLAVGAQKHDNNDTAAEYVNGEAAKKRELVHKQVSFTMATLVQHLQMSLRNPISREEAVACVRCVAEVVPEWVGVRELGRLVGVIVRGPGVGRGELRERVNAALERL